MSPSPNCPTKTVSGLYIPEGHPLRNDTADAVREYFRGATTSQIGSSLGVCNSCGSGNQTTVKTERQQVLEYAAKAISEANKILGSRKTNPSEREDVTAARDVLQALLDRNASTDEIREQVSACKIINEAVVANIKKR
jgi:Trp operon repressor